MQSVRTHQPPVPSTVPYHAKFRMNPSQPPAVVSHDFCQFGAEALPSSYYHRQSLAENVFNQPSQNMDPQVQHFLLQASSDPTLYQQQSQLAPENTLRQQNFPDSAVYRQGHLSAEALPFCHQAPTSDRSTFQHQPATSSFLPNQQPAVGSVLFSHPNQMPVPSTLYQQPNQSVPDASMYQQNQPTMETPLYPHPSQRIAPTAPSVSEGPMFVQTLSAVEDALYRNQRSADSSIYHQANQPAPEPTLYHHPSQPTADASVYHHQEANVYHHSNPSLPGAPSHFLNQNHSAAPQAPTFFHQNQASSEGPPFFRYQNQLADTHFQGQNQHNAPFYHLQSQSMGAQFHQQQNQNHPEASFHSIQNQRPAEALGAIGASYYRHRNQVDTQLCSSNPSVAEAQVFQFQNQPAQETHQHNRAAPDVPMFPFQGHVPQESRLLPQNLAPIELPIVNYQNQAAQEAQIRQPSQSDLPMFHYQSQEAQVRQQNPTASELPIYHYQNQAAQGAQFHQPALIIAKTPLIELQKQGDDSVQKCVNVARIQQNSFAGGKPHSSVIPAFLGNAIADGVKLPLVPLKTSKTDSTASAPPFSENGVSESQALSGAADAEALADDTGEEKTVHKLDVSQPDKSFVKVLNEASTDIVKEANRDRRGQEFVPHSTRNAPLECQALNSVAVSAEEKTTVNSTVHQLVSPSLKSIAAENQPTSTAAAAEESTGMWKPHELAVPCLKNVASGSQVLNCAAVDFVEEINENDKEKEADNFEEKSSEEEHQDFSLAELYESFQDHIGAQSNSAQDICGILGSDDKVNDLGLCVLAELRVATPGSKLEDGPYIAHESELIASIKSPDENMNETGKDIPNRNTDGRKEATEPPSPQSFNESERHSEVFNEDNEIRENDCHVSGAISEVEPPNQVQVTNGDTPHVPGDKFTADVHYQRSDTSSSSSSDSELIPQSNAVLEANSVVLQEKQKLPDDDSHLILAVSAPNTHLFPMPPNILCTLPGNVVSDFKNIPTTETRQSESDLSNIPLSQEASDELGSALEVLFDESANHGLPLTPPPTPPFSPPLLTPPCVTPPLCTPPSLSFGPSPLSSVPSSPRSSTPPFSSPLSTSPRSDHWELHKSEEEPEFKQNDCQSLRNPSNVCSSAENPCLAEHEEVPAGTHRQLTESLVWNSSSMAKIPIADEEDSSELQFDEICSLLSKTPEERLVDAEYARAAASNQGALTLNLFFPTSELMETSPGETQSPLYLAALAQELIESHPLHQRLIETDTHLHFLSQLPGSLHVDSQVQDINPQESELIHAPVEEKPHFASIEERDSLAEGAIKDCCVVEQLQTTAHSIENGSSLSSSDLSTTCSISGQEVLEQAEDIGALPGEPAKENALSSPIETIEFHSLNTRDL